MAGCKKMMPVNKIKILIKDCEAKGFIRCRITSFPSPSPLTPPCQSLGAGWGEMSCGPFATQKAGSGPSRLRPGTVACPTYLRSRPSFFKVYHFEVQINHEFRNFGNEQREWYLTYQKKRREELPFSPLSHATGIMRDPGYSIARPGCSIDFSSSVQ